MTVYGNPDAFGVSGHGPALSYTDNLDGTFTDNNTGYMWEKKPKADGSEGGNRGASIQADRSVHCVNNTYTWTDTGDGDNTDPDGTLFIVFLAELNTSAFAGFSDWCITNVKKLQSIVNLRLIQQVAFLAGLRHPTTGWLLPPPSLPTSRGASISSVDSRRRRR